MTQPLDRPLAALFVACREYCLTNPGNDVRHRRGEHYKQLETALTASLHAMAALHSVKYPGWSVDKDHAGYLMRFEPPMQFRVPYHVLPAFPTGDELLALWYLSRKIRTGNRSVISISGSNVLRKIFDVVGDIDFCEYFAVSDNLGFQKLVSNMDGSEKIACMRLAIHDKEWRYPWGDDRPTKEYFARTFDNLDEDKSTLKVDYIGDVEDVGVTEITNVIIAVDDKGHSAGFTKTFAAQEAPLVPIDWLPNQMNNPIEMGRYVYWLTNSILALSEAENMRKCLKRCASLSRILFTPDITNDIIDLVNNSTVPLDHKIGELKKLASMFGPLKDDRSRRFITLIERQLERLNTTLEERGGAPDEIARKRFNDEGGNIVTRLLRQVQPVDDPSARRAA